MAEKIFEKQLDKPTQEHPSKGQAPKTILEARMQQLGKYKSVQRWRQKVPNNSTFSYYLMTLQKLLVYVTEKKYVSSDGKLLNPDGIIELVKTNPEKVDEIFSNFSAEQLSKEKYAGSSKNTLYAALQSFVQRNSYVRMNFERPKMSTLNLNYVDASFSLTKDHLTAMMEAVKDDPEKLVAVGLSAQVAQRRGVLSSLRVGQVKGIWDHSTDPIVVFVPYDQRDSQERFVNKGRCNYRFGFLRDSAQLIRNVVGEKPPSRNDKAFLWDLRPSFFNDAILEAASKVGIQRVVKTLMGHKRHVLHHHVLRAYWKSCMRAASSKTGDPELANPIFLDFFLGHTESRYKGTYDRYDDLFVKNALTKAHEQLELPKVR